MRKLSEILYKIIFVALIIVSLCGIILILSSWSYKPKDEIINNPNPSRLETIILDSEEELPFESSFGKDEKAKAFVTYREDILTVWLFNPEISKYFFRWEKEIKPSGDSWYVTSWFSGSIDFYIKNVSVKDDLLEIELGISKGDDIGYIIIFVFMTALAILCLKYPY